NIYTLSLHDALPIYREGRRKARPGNRRRVEPREREQSPALEPRVEGLLALLPGHGLPLVEAVRRDETAAPLDRVLKQAAFGHGLGFRVDRGELAVFHPRGVKAPLRHDDPTAAIVSDHDGHGLRRRDVVARRQVFEACLLDRDAEPKRQLVEGGGLRVAATHGRRSATPLLGKPRRATLAFREERAKH